MHKYYLSVVLVRLLLPAGLLLSIALRPFGLSLIYLLFYLIAPFPLVPDSKTFNGWRGKFLLLTVVVSVLLLLVHAAWHCALAAFGTYGSILEEYPLIQKIGHNLGLVTYDGIDVHMAVHFLAPELVMTGASLVVYLVTRKLLIGYPNDEVVQKDSKHRRFPFLTSAGKYIALFLIMFSGIMRPSITSGIYFLVFMGAATSWSLGRTLDRGFAVVSRCVMAIMAVHITVLLVYQCSWLITIYPPDNNFARYFGLTKLVIINETDPSNFTYEVTDDYMWATLASPLVILFTYYFLAMEARELFKPKVAFSYINSNALRGNADETTPLMRTVSPSKKWSSIRSGSLNRQLQQDSTGSVVIPDEESVLEIEEPSLMDDIVAAIIDFFQVLVRSSYIATTITMMAWSIMYHSWLTFVFLMWANIVWLCQDQRSFMLRTSPILVCYAMLLLLVQYIYGMNLYESELPSNITEVNLRQIGVGRVEGEPCWPLLVKSLFTCMFWVTLRQRVTEMRARSRSSLVADMAAPLHLTASTAASALEGQREDESRSRLLRAAGEWLRAACARYWIYVVVIMLFVIGVTGERMTIFRIIYMFLFLVFILMFQISWFWWRRLMYIFWITVIMYSMINLILIYIYQFDNFSKMIETYLMINERLQHDLGLEPYHPADLFVKLLTPTLFLIITIMQVHYFHKDFMALSDPKTRTNSIVRDLESSRPSQAGVSTMKDDIPALPLEEEKADKLDSDSGSDTEAEHSLETTSANSANRRSVLRKPSRSRSYAATLSERESTALKPWLLARYTSGRRLLAVVIDKAFIFLDIHLIKIIFLSLMLLCVFNVCAMHVPIMIIISPGLLLSARQQRVCVLFISTLISVYFMAKMVYQIEYIKQSFFDVNCTQVNANYTLNDTMKTYNNAEWVGFVKATKKIPLVVLLKGYIAMIALFTFYSLVTYRQETIREVGLLPKDKEKIMFPEITRKEADQDMIHCIKYLMNYGFYKFGVEISLICLMGVVGSRMDVYAVIYACWLLALVSLRRARQQRLWPAFTACFTVLLPLQYMIAVGFLPQLCVQYIWAGDDQQIKHIRTWLFLPYTDEPPHAVKLIFDYFMLLFAARQLNVFRIEKSNKDSYPGGCNSENTGKDWETPSFVNPVPDFLGYVGSWLDVIKRMVFLGMLWITLAIMFMTGTNRVNLFSMGYLIGSFIFLWQGTDFYLRPKKAILQWWSWLLRYNVSVVVIKALLQIPGCIFSTVMQEHACWLVQLLGIGCVDKFAGGNIARFIKMHYDKDSVCSVPQEDIGLAWDGVCFAFLILQRRLFHSYYFFRVIDESKATTVLASRGAELIEELRQKQMLVQEEQEVKILEKIKVKMERIKANQKKIQGVIAKEPIHHDAEEEEEEEETQPGESEQVPLVRGDSEESRRGYHTPVSPATPRGFHTPLSVPSAPPSPVPSRVPSSVPPHNPITAPPSQPSSHPGPPSPSSALMTVSLDAYLEPRRISFESPPSSDLLPRAHSPEESYPVFSPPPIRRRHTVASPSVLQRTSIISYSSRAEPNSHHTSVRSGDYYMFDEFDDTDVHLKEDESSSDEEAPKEMGFGKLMSTVIKTDMRRAVSLRRASAPALRPSTGSLSYPHKLHTLSSRAELARAGEVDLTMTDRGRPGPSSELDEFAPPPEGETWIDKIKGLLDTAGAFISSILVSITRYLMKYSRDYRYVSRTLSVEKKILKEKDGFGIGLREGSQMIWEPLPEALTHQEIEHSNDCLVVPDVEMGGDSSRKLSAISVPEIRILAPSMERGLDESPCASRPPSPLSSDSDDTSEHESAFSLQTSESKDVTTLEDQDDSMFKQGKSPLLHLAYALWFAILAHTDIVCYIMVFINQIQSATILSIPLPLMVFLWGTLTIPRPTKTFWVTLIAYTEVIVLIKSMFQFEILPWNQKAIPANMPFTAPRIIGIERNYNYALYDLLLLLIIFLHRFMLKSLGLWKESTPEVELHEDMDYHISPDDTQLLVEGRGAEVGKKYVQLHDQTAPGLFATRQSLQPHWALRRASNFTSRSSSSSDESQIALHPALSTPHPSPKKSTLIKIMRRSIPRSIIRHGTDGLSQHIAPTRTDLRLPPDKRSLLRNRTISSDLRTKMKDDVRSLSETTESLAPSSSVLSGSRAIPGLNQLPATSVITQTRITSDSTETRASAPIDPYETTPNTTFEPILPATLMGSNVITQSTTSNIPKTSTDVTMSTESSPRTDLTGQEPLTEPSDQNYSNIRAVPNVLAISTASSAPVQPTVSTRSIASIEYTTPTVAVPTELALPTDLVAPITSSMPDQPTVLTGPDASIESTTPTVPIALTEPSDHSVARPQLGIPTDPVAPSKSSLPGQPTVSTAPSVAVAITEPSTLTEPLDYTDLTVVVVPTELTTPVQPTVPTEPNAATAPTESTIPTEPSAPLIVILAPADPSRPIDLSETYQLTAPNEPSTSTAPNALIAPLDVKDIVPTKPIALAEPSTSTEPAPPEAFELYPSTKSSSADTTVAHVPYSSTTVKTQSHSVASTPDERSPLVPPPTPEGSTPFIPLTVSEIYAEQARRVIRDPYSPPGIYSPSPYFPLAIPETSTPAVPSATSEVYPELIRRASRDPYAPPEMYSPYSLLKLALRRFMTYLQPPMPTSNQEEEPNEASSSPQIEQTSEHLEPIRNGPQVEDAHDHREEPGPSRSIEDDHYKFNDDKEPIIAVTTTIEDNYRHYPHIVLLSFKRYLRPTKRFFQRMLAPGARVTADIYAYMFLCDFLNFLVVIFGFAAFGTHQGDGGVQAYLEENKVPIPFLVMLILQFGLIVVDRALYLRKYMLGKILFQYILIIGVHIWMFFVLPFITERTFNTLLPPPMWYMVKCIYLLLSAYQIRCGYPRRIIGNFLCKSYRFLNMVCFRGFMAIPFLFELRTLMDWIWTDTSMTLMDWLKMEDIFASIFLLKCSRYVEDEFPQPRGAKKSSTSKYLLGGGVLAFVIAIIWFPLVFFAFGNTVGQPNPPTDVTVKIRIGPFLPVYQMTAQSHNIDVYTEQDYTQLSNLYARDRTAQTFLSNYMYDDVAVITINPNSTMKWVISPPELDRLEREASSNSSLSVKFTYVITHPSNNAQNPPTIENNREVPLPAFENGKPNPERETLLRLLAGTAEPDTWLNVPLLFPKFVKVFNKGVSKPAYQLMPPISGTESDDARFYRNVKIRLERQGNASMFWRVHEACESRDPLATIPMNNCDLLVMYTFNDKLFPETLNFISGGGIIGLYTTFVFLASRVLRGFFSGIYTRIMFDDLPNADRVLQLCLDIYLVREALELALEEDLFAKLVFLYRSPETMIKWSRPKEEDNQEQRALPAPN